MPGPGQGKRAQKKKGCESAPKLNENTAAVNAVTTAPSTANMPATDTTYVSTATTASSTNEPVTYSHDEVQQLLENARSDGWQEGYKAGSRKLMQGYREGYKARQKLDQGREEQARNEGQLKGYEFGKDEERAKWLVEGHGPGMCISMWQHIQGIKTCDESVSTEEDSWKHSYGHCISIEEGHLRLVTEVAKAIASKEAKLPN